MEQAAIETTASVSSAELSRVLGRKELFAMATSQIIGVGIMVLIGVGIGYTGRSVNLAFILAALFTICMTVPMIFIGGTLRLRGGNYTILAALLGKTWAGASMIISIISNMAISIYPISFASYFLGLTGLNISPAIIASVCLTFFYVLNIFGMKKVSMIQNTMIICLIAALVIFMAFGVTKVNWSGAFGGGEDWMTGGLNGLFMASATLTYATGGATSIINFGAEAKNPTKDIPIVIIVSTLTIAVVYAIMGTVAAGVLPVSQVAGQSLLMVAKKILPVGFYEFFIIGGAMFALMATLNAMLGMMTKPLLQACIDGWFPKKLGYIHPKFKTPVILLTIFYVIGMIPIIFSFSISTVTSLILIVGKFFGIATCMAVVNLPKKVPEIWANSKVHISTPLLWAVGLLATGSVLAQFLILSANQPTYVWWGNLVLIIAAFAYAYFRNKSGAVKMEVSYEAA